MEPRLWTTLAIALALLALPSAAGAETALIGPADLTPSLGSGNAVCAYSGCQRLLRFQSFHPAGSAGDVPITGSITSWRVRGTAINGAGLSLMTVRLGSFPPGYTAIAISAPATTMDGITSNPTSLPYQAGDRIAIVLTASGSGSVAGLATKFLPSSSGASYADFSPSFAPGSPEEDAQELIGSDDDQLLYNATVTSTPPADQNSPGGGAALGVKASISSLSLSPSAFTAANSGGSVIAKVGGKVSFSLDRANTVTFTVSKVGKGRKSGKKCVKQKRINRKKKSCTLYTKVKGSFTRDGTAGTNSFTFSGRINNKALRKSKYRLEAVAGSGATQSALATSQFRIK